MHKWFAVLALTSAASLTACGGGSGGGSGLGGGGLGGLYGGSPPQPVASAPPQPVASATPQPVASATPASTGNLPLQQTVAGSVAWVDSASHRTLYSLDVDTATGSACTGTCLSLWPVLAPSSGAQAQGNLSIISRSDGTGKQWAFQGHPLYFFAGDSGPDQANGEGIPQSGGHWHVARPSSSSGGSGGCHGYYC